MTQSNKKIGLLTLILGISLISNAQKYHLISEVEEISLPVGDQFKVNVKMLDQSNKEVDQASFNFYPRPSKIFKIDSNGLINSLAPGTGMLVIIGRLEGQDDYARLELPVIIENAEVAQINLSKLPSEIYEGQVITLDASLVDDQQFEVQNADFNFSSSNSKVAVIDLFGNITALQKGKTTLKVTAGVMVAEAELAVKVNPVSKLNITSDVIEARTGDVIYFDVRALDVEGNTLEGLNFNYSFTGTSASPSEFTSGMIQDDGRFVADIPGKYTITAAFGGLNVTKMVKIIPRNVTEKVILTGHGAVSNVHSSDLWVWEGIDGRDYCVTGTWGGNGEAYFWDVTDPDNLVTIDTITVDARTFNDVKVSEDGRICVISREGASNRKNGLVIIDVSNPRDTKIISTFDQGLTGGVHNVFVYKNHIYALSNGERYDIISIEDPKNPKKVGSFEIDRPGHSIHDVWVVDGIAYSSNWSYGVWMVDVGNGIAGGSPSNPKVITNYAYPSGWNHAAFPYWDKKTGKFYVIAGDEAFPNGLNTEDGPTIPAGFLHFIDFTDLQHPVEVAKYEVPGAGSHNLWVEDDVLYVGNYNAGLRVVDISGDLMGDLYKQGREIAWFLPSDPKGRIANAPMTWGPQPHKGHVFFTDWNSGLWSVKVGVKQPENIKIDKK
jgi:hypothetical protein